MIIGTKSDLENDRVVTYNEAIEFATERGQEYIEISSKEGTNCELALAYLCMKIRERIDPLPSNNTIKKINIPKLEAKKAVNCNVQ